MEGRKPSWPLWITVVLVGLPVLYVLSFGPACWIASCTGTDQDYLFQTAYWPLGKACLGKTSAGEFLSAYARLCLPQGTTVAIPSQYGESAVSVIITE